jgi:hypothetical protein
MGTRVPSLGTKQLGYEAAAAEVRNH